jgi:glycosyltransferase involved in cell wall biosynthesis
MPEPAWDGRILYISTVDISLPNGPGVNEREFCLSLVRNLGDQVALILPEPARHTPDLDILRPYATFTRAPQGKGLFRSWGPQKEQYRTALEEHRRQPFDLVVTRLGQYPLGTYWLLKKTGLPLAVKAMGIGIPNIPKAYRGLHGLAERLRQRLRRPVHRWVVRALLRRAIAIDAGTPEKIHQLTAHLPIDPNKVFQVTNATNVNRFTPRDPEEARQETGLEGYSPILGFAGSQPARKSGPEMIAVGARLREEFPDLGVVILGGNVAELGALAREHGMEDRTVLVGKVPYDEVPDYIAAFDAGFALHDPAWEATTGNDMQKVRQYLACGVPTIASPGGNDFLETEGLGSLVAAEDLEGLTEAARQWLRMPRDQQTTFRQRAHDYIARHMSTDAVLAERLAIWRGQLNGSATDKKGYARRDI